MASLFNYDVLQSPDPVNVTAKVSGIDATQVTIEIAAIEDFEVAFRSVDEGVTQVVADAIAALAELFKLDPAEKARELLTGQSRTFPFAKPLGFSLPAGGDTVTLTATELELGSHHGMLMAGGTVQVS